MRNLTNRLFAGTLGLAMVASLCAQTTEKLTAKVIHVKGSARFTTGNNVWQPLKVGTIIHPGTIIQTDMEDGSYVDLLLGDGSESSVSPVTYNPAAPGSAGAPPPAYESKASQSVVRLADNTLLGVDKLTTLNKSEDVTDTRLDLKSGHILFNVKKLSAASRFEIKVPNGVAGIRGTAGEIIVKILPPPAQPDVTVRCFAGSIVHARTDGSNVSHAQEIAGGNQEDGNGQITPIPESAMKSFPADLMHPLDPGPPSSVPFNPTAIEHVSPHVPGNPNGP